MRKGFIYVCIVTLAIFSAYIHFLIDIILNELIRAHFYSTTTRYVLGGFARDVQFYYLSDTFTADIHKVIPSKDRVQFVRSLNYCVRTDAHGITLFDEKPYEALKFFFLLLQAALCYILIELHVPFHGFIETSIEMTLYYEVLNQSQPAFPLFYMWAQVIFLAVLTIGARSVGPRFRPDQMSQVTGKDILLLLGGLLILSIILIILI